MNVEDFWGIQDLLQSHKESPVEGLKGTELVDKGNRSLEQTETLERSSRMLS